ncbi:YybH family protein [Kiloniella majae]|uniref:YybH family protein n=1 Tax=Kiloniella majae TaxID=1938558 RepID=UPI000A27713D|nr:DUF4440 domain-containing protein [Kiloniella majae]
MLKKRHLSAACWHTFFLKPVVTIALTISLLSSPLYAASQTQLKRSTSMTIQKQTIEEQNVLSLIQKMTSNFEQGNLEVVMSTYEENAAIMFEPGTAVNDNKISEQIFAEFKSLNPKFSYSGHEVIVAGNIALHIAPWSMKGKTPDGQEVTETGLSVAVLRQQKDGSWKMVIDNPHGNHLLKGQE